MAEPTLIGEIKALEAAHKKLVGRYVRDGKRHYIMRAVALDLCGGNKERLYSLVAAKRQELIDKGEMPANPKTGS